MMASRVMVRVDATKKKSVAQPAMRGIVRLLALRAAARAPTEKRMDAERWYIEMTLCSSAALAFRPPAQQALCALRWRHAAYDIAVDMRLMLVVIV